MTYKLASDPKEYAACHRLMKEQGLKPERLGWPTMMVYQDDGSLKGFLATQRDRTAVIAGPLVMAVQSPKTVVNLITAYENLLISAGVTFYWFHVFTENATWKKLVDLFKDKHGGIEPLQATDDGAWYKRVLA